MGVITTWENYDVHVAGTSVYVENYKAGFQGRTQEQVDYLLEFDARLHLEVHLRDDILRQSMVSRATIVAWFHAYGEWVRNNHRSLVRMFEDDCRHGELVPHRAPGMTRCYSGLLELNGDTKELRELMWACQPRR